jgi:tRNA A-37 threonylcarbamoyl transferase component Bud32
MTKEYPFILKHVKGIDEEAKDIFEQEGFQIYPTVETTILLYHQDVNCFFKILQPLNLKKKISKFLINRARQIYSLSAILIQRKIKVPRIRAYGTFRNKRRPFFAMERVEGTSLYELLLREKIALPIQTYIKVVKEIAKLHNNGYWLGDAHLSHIFVKNNLVSGFIDIDSIRRNIPFSLKKLAKDLAGLNHPNLPIRKDEKKMLFQHYIKAMRINNEKNFSELIKHYTERRWKESA